MWINCVTYLHQQLGKSHAFDVIESSLSKYRTKDSELKLGE